LCSGSREGRGPHGRIKGWLTIPAVHGQTGGGQDGDTKTRSLDRIQQQLVRQNSLPEFYLNMKCNMGEPQSLLLSQSGVQVRWLGIKQRQDPGANTLMLALHV
jgi:hypothetical protein